MYSTCILTSSFRRKHTSKQVDGTTLYKICPPHSSNDRWSEKHCWPQTKYTQSNTLDTTCMTVQNTQCFDPQSVSQWGSDALFTNKPGCTQNHWIQDQGSLHKDLIPRQ